MLSTLVREQAFFASIINTSTLLLRIPLNGSLSRASPLGLSLRVFHPIPIRRHRHALRLSDHHPVLTPMPALLLVVQLIVSTLRRTDIDRVPDIAFSDNRFLAAVPSGDRVENRAGGAALFGRVGAVFAGDDVMRVVGDSVGLDHGVDDRLGEGNSGDGDRKDGVEGGGGLEAESDPGVVVRGLGVGKEVVETDDRERNGEDIRRKCKHGIELLIALGIELAEKITRKESHKECGEDIHHCIDGPESRLVTLTQTLRKESFGSAYLVNAAA